MRLISGGALWRHKPVWAGKYWGNYLARRRPARDQKHCMRQVYSAPVSVCIFVFIWRFVVDKMGVGRVSDAKNITRRDWTIGIR